MKLLGLLTLLASIQLATLPAEASYPRCDDPEGYPIQIVVDKTFEGPAAATRDKLNNPIIIFNPDIMAEFTSAFGYFVYFHECAHHTLAHTRLIKINPDADDIQELDADCWGIQTALKRGYVKPNQLPEVVRQMANWERDPSHPEGTIRSSNVLRCAQRTINRY